MATVAFLKRNILWISLGLLGCCVIAALIAILVTIYGPQETPAKSPWAYKCVDKRSKRVDATDPQSMSLSVSRLTCGDRIGTLWPYPTGIVDWNKTVVPFNLGKMITSRDITTGVTGQNKGLFDEAGQIFRQRVKNKAPDGFKSKRNLVGVRIYFDEINPTHATFDKYGEGFYQLIITQGFEDSDVVVNIRGLTYFAIQHGLQTLNQLIVFDEINNQFMIPISLTIVDEAVFRHRGLSLDTSRNYYSVAAIKRTIDAMSLSKLNVFHWHITDSQSFPLVVDSHPELSELGAYEPHKIYTKDNIKEIVAFGRVRGVAVIPEIDAPAHVGNGWQNTDLVACFNAHPWNAFCLEPPCGQLDPTRKELYPVLGDIYQETVESFQNPYLFHMGGDEVLSACWKNSTRIVEWITSQGWGQTEGDHMKLWMHFQENAFNVLHERINYQPQIVLWSSSLTEDPYLEQLDKERYIIQIWGSSGDAKFEEPLKKGFKVIFSNHDALYLDCGFGGWVTDGNNWCGPYIGWQKVYNNRMGTPSSDQIYRENILGGEAALWSEQTDEHSVDSRLWPRASALAERLWTNPDGDWREAESRMLVHREELVRNGIAAEAIQPEWCVRNEGDCPI